MRMQLVRSPLIYNPVSVQNIALIFTSYTPAQWKPKKFTFAGCGRISAPFSKVLTLSLAKLCSDTADDASISDAGYCHMGFPKEISF